MRIAVLLIALTLGLLHAVARGAPPVDVANPPANSRMDGPDTFSIALGAGTSAEHSPLEHPAANDCVTIRFTAWRRSGSLFSTSGPNGDPVTQCVAQLLPALARVLGTMTPGERRRAWLPTQIAPHGAGPADDAVPTEPLTVDLELIRIDRAPPTPQDLVTPPASARRFGSGVSMSILEKGSGHVPVSEGSKLTLTYSAWSASGKLLESTAHTDHPATLPLALTPPGWREALQTMVAGEKVRLWIPARLIADRPPGDRVYDLQLLRVE